MISRYRLLAQRIRTQMTEVERLVNRAEGAVNRAAKSPADQDYFIAAAALDLHSFYAGIERLFELITADVERSQPGGAHWHRDLLAQMALDVPGIRPPVITAETQAALADYLEFRHVVRNVYTFNLRPHRVAELVDHLRKTFDLANHDLHHFAAFLDQLATADE
jgi:hypothetical protein